MLNNPVFILHPGAIESKHDGDTHQVSYERLIQLYGLKPSECYRFRGFFAKGVADIHLYPRYNGDYQEYLASVLKAYGKRRSR